MTTLLIILPLLFGLIALSLPSDRLRPLLLPLGSLIQLGLVIKVIVDPTPLAVGHWLGIDALGRLLLLLVTVLFLLCAIYGASYLRFKGNPDNRIFVTCLFAFLSAMSMAAVARHLGILWVAVEATTLASAPLIYYKRTRLSIEATWKYLMLCSVGIALAMLGILFIAYSILPAESISLQLDTLVASAAGFSPPWLRAGFIFLLIGFGTKVGFAPLHTWKPDAYGEAPGMVGALLAGGLTSVAFVGLLRTLQIMNAAGQGETARHAFLIMGVMSLFFAAVFVIRQPDFKRLLAYSSVEHMGVLAIGIGIGGIATFGAMLHMMNNAMTKGTLFLSAGNIHRRFASKHRESVTGAIGVVPVSSAIFIAAFLAITGSPPFGLFISEFTILRGIFNQGSYGLGTYFLVMLSVICIGMGSTVLAVTLGRPSVKEEQSPYRDSLKTVGPPLFLLLMVLCLGLYLPEPVKKFFTDAAAIVVEVKL